MRVAKICGTMKNPRNPLGKITTVLVLLAVCCVNSAAAETSSRDIFVLDLINQYRAAPFAHAVSLGYDPVVLQEKGIDPETVLAPYELDEELSNAAHDANSPASAVDAEAESIPPVRARTTRTSSVFSFFYFIPMETAAQVFVENLFKNELDSGVFQFVLSKEFQYAGTAVDPGVVAETRMNAWFVSLVLGSSERVSEMQMLNLINQVRAYPPQTQYFIHTDSVALFDQNPNLHYLREMQFSPLFPDEVLQHWARADVAMSGTSQEDVSGTDVGVSVADFHQSYPGKFFQTATVAASWQDMTTARPVADLFSALLYSELSTWPYGGAVVFSKYYAQAGVAINLETIENTGIGVVSIHAGSYIDWSLVPEETEQPPQETEQVRIYGLVFFDHDDNRMYSPGEEVMQQTVSVYELTQDPLLVPDENPAFVNTVVTDNAGHFSLSLAPGRQWVFEAEKDGETVRRIIHIEEDHFVKMFFSPTYPVLDAP